MKSFDPRRLVGAWQLVRWYTTYEDGSVTVPKALVPYMNGVEVLRPKA